MLYIYILDDITCLICTFFEILAMYMLLWFVASLNKLEEAEGLDPKGSTSNIGPLGILQKPNFISFHSFIT